MKRTQVKSATQCDSVPLFRERAGFPKSRLPQGPKALAFNSRPSCRAHTAHEFRRGSHVRSMRSMRSMDADEATRRPVKMIARHKCLGRAHRDSLQTTGHRLPRKHTTTDLEPLGKPDTTTARKPPRNRAPMARSHRPELPGSVSCARTMPHNSRKRLFISW